MQFDIMLIRLLLTVLTDTVHVLLFFECAANLACLDSPSQFKELLNGKAPILTCFQPGMMSSAMASDILIYFGACMPTAGTRVFHQRNFDRDGETDLTMAASGSGFFSFNPRARIPSWRYRLLCNLVLPVTFMFHPKIGKNYDVLPEFVAALMPHDFFASNNAHYSARGQTDVNGASAARFQLSAFQIGGEQWKAQRKGHVTGVKSRLSQLGFVGWVGCDMHGQIELFLITPLPLHILAFDGFEGGQH
jgi:hypothetical protein